VCVVYFNVYVHFCVLAALEFFVRVAGTWCVA